MNKLCIGNIELDAPVMLAPMAGMSDLAFREICEDFGAAYTCTEMVSAKALCFNDEKTKKILQRGRCKKPFAVQIFGSEPDIMAKAAIIALEISGASVLDINMGCPMPKIVSNGDGSALMKNPMLAENIVRAVKNAVSVPVTVKHRLGWDEKSINAVEFAKAVENGGASAVCVHARTAKQLYTGMADIAKIAEVVSAVKIPVIANGDILCGEDAVNVLKMSGAAGVAVGRGALGNPWIFREIRCAFEGKNLPEQPAPTERISVFLTQIDRTRELKGEHTAILEARSHFCKYIRNFAGAAVYRSKMNMVQNFGELEKLVAEIKGR